MKKLSFWEGVFLIVGTQIGAGVLSLPFAISPLGFFWGFIVILFSCLFSMLTALCIVEAIHNSGKDHYYGMSRKYLGPFGVLLVFSIVFSSYFTLSAYIHGYSKIFPFGGIFLWFLGSLLLFFGVKVSGRAEKILGIFLILIFLVITVWTLPYVKGYYASFDLPMFMYAFNFCFFAFFAHTVIPEVAHSLGVRGSATAILTAFTITCLIYLAFSLSVAGAVGQPSQIGTLSLVNILRFPVVVLAYFLPILTMATSYIGVGCGLKDILSEMFGRRVGFLLAVIPPLFLSSFSDFAGLIFIASFGTIVAGGVLPPLLLILSRRNEGRKLFPLDDTLVALMLLFGFVVIVFHLCTPLLGFS